MQTEFVGRGGITASIVADSINNGNRITTMQLRYPRFVHAEFMTHRMFSRNASSSRAIPVAKMIEQVRNDPAMPIHWGANQPGMQAHAELPTGITFECMEIWQHAAWRAANTAERMTNNGLHKQVANRILEPFQFISVVVTATDWDNFFALRMHPDAQPEIQELAIVMKDAMNDSSPRPLLFGQWHLPYVQTQTEYNGGQSYWHRTVACGKQEIGLDMGVMASVARCARVSYLTHDGAAPDINKDIELYERLVGSVPLHASPCEHQATPRGHDYTANFKGWASHRSFIE